MIQLSEAIGVTAGLYRRDQQTPSRPSLVRASRTTKLAPAEHVQASAPFSVFKSVSWKFRHTSRPPPDVNIILSSMLLLLNSWCLLHLLNKDSTAGAAPLFTAAAGLLTDRLKAQTPQTMLSFWTPRTVPMQIRLAIATLKGLIFHLRHQGSIQHISTCLSFMITLKNLCQDKQVIAEAFACEGEQIA